MLFAASHGFLTVFLVAGAPIAARRPRVMRWYLIALIPTGAVNLAGQPCPLTVWEKHFWRMAGETPYRGGFISQYFVEPFYAPGLGDDDDVVLLVLMVIWCILWLLVAVFSHRRQGNSTPGSALEAEERQLRGSSGVLL